MSTASLRTPPLSLLLDCVYVVVFLLALPVLAFLVLFRKRGLGSVSERLGASPVQPASGKNRIWLHAVSVGEVEAALPLIDQLERVYPGSEIVVSTTTANSQAVAQKKCGGRSVFYFPLDFGFCMRRALRRIRPQMVIMVELELWPNIVLNCAANGIPMVIVNGRVSDRGFRRMSWGRWLLAPFFDRLARASAQNDQYAERLRRLGVAADRVAVTGNLKFDKPAVADPEDARRQFDAEWGYTQGSPRWIGGCTHTGEEEVLLAAHQELRRRASCQGLSLVLAPRHIERAPEVAELARAAGFEAALLAEVGQRPAPDVVVVDRIGVLMPLYASADVAFVGGSLIQRGGHNLLEPVLAGTPALHGPNMQNFRDVVALLTDGGATARVTGQAELTERVGEWLEDSNERVRRCELGRELLEPHRGVAPRIAEDLAAHVPLRPR